MALTPETSENTIIGGFEKVSYPTTSWLYNEMTGRLEYSTDNKAIIAQDIDGMLSIERYIYEIFTTNAGIETTDLPGQDLGVIVSQVESRIKDCLSVDDRILSVDNFEYEQLDKRSIKITFKVNTIYGEMEKEVNITL